MTAYWYLALVVVVFSFGFISGASWATGKRGGIQIAEGKLEEANVPREEAHPICR
jgi:hypothetical protein